MKSLLKTTALSCLTIASLGLTALTSAQVFSYSRESFNQQTIYQPQMNNSHLDTEVSQMKHIANLQPTNLQEQLNKVISGCDDKVEVAGYYCFVLCDQQYPDDWEQRDKCKEECARRMAPDV